MEASWYLAYKVSESDGGVGISRNRNHRCIKYFNSLRIESCSTETTMSYLRILSKSSLEKLRKLLGAGVGLGVARKRPTIAAPSVCCTIGCILTCVDAGAEVPYETLLNPSLPCQADGIGFIFYEQRRTLSCTIRFSKVVVREREDAMSRIPMAFVRAAESGIFLNVWFTYEDNLLEVIGINEATVNCAYVEELQLENVLLPIELV